MILVKISVVQVAKYKESIMTNNVIINENKFNINSAPKLDNYRAEIIEKETNEIILTYTDKNMSEVLDFASQFPLNIYSRRIMGVDTCLWES